MKTKYTLKDFALYDRTGLEKDLEKQAEKGWLLEKINELGFWKFRGNKVDRSEWEVIEVDEPVWNAEEVYKLKHKGNWYEKYIVCYDDRIIEIYTSWEMTDEQKVTVCEKLTAI